MAMSNTTKSIMINHLELVSKQGKFSDESIPAFCILIQGYLNDLHGLGSGCDDKKYEAVGDIAIICTYFIASRGGRAYQLFKAVDNEFFSIPDKGSDEILEALMYYTPKIMAEETPGTEVEAFLFTLASYAKKQGFDFWLAFQYAYTREVSDLIERLEKEASENKEISDDEEDDIFNDDELCVITEDRVPRFIELPVLELAKCHRRRPWDYVVLSIEDSLISITCFVEDSDKSFSLTDNPIPSQLKIMENIADYLETMVNTIAAHYGSLEFNSLYCVINRDHTPGLTAMVFTSEDD